jgi:putative serine protease PepD
MPSNRKVATVAAAALIGGGAGAAIVTLADDGGSSKTATVTTAATGANVASTDLTVGQVAKTAIKSVVEVDATSSGDGSTFPFGNNGSQSAEGTGFVYDTKGDIVTNQHVVSGASTVKVKFSDGSTYTATVVGTDSATDIAVLRVNAPSSKLNPLTLADSTKVSVGDGVVAIGNPFGLDGTVTSGIVSAVGREISSPDDTPIEGAIQTDAAINHGNSGGPLLDLHGEVIGITSQIQSEGGGNDGVGFAVPSNTVKSIAAQLISNGKAQHALLGVTPTDTANGVRIATVRTGSAADDAGLKAGDVIATVGSTRITGSAQLRAIIAGHEPGDGLTLTIKRNGSTKTVHVTLGVRS